VITAVLFTVYAYKHHRQAFKEYSFKLGMALFGLVQLSTVNFFLTRAKYGDSNKIPNPLLSTDYLGLQILQSFSVIVFVTFKQPVDLFRVFNKRPDIQFSVFQYPNFFYAEQRLRLMQNKDLI
jgi:hypothetical protein